MEFIKNNWKVMLAVTAALAVSVVIGKTIKDNNQEDVEVLTSEENEA